MLEPSVKPFPAAVSFRDPAGALYRAGNRVIRRVRSDAFPEVAAFLESKTAADFSARRNLIGTRHVDLADLPDGFISNEERADSVLLEHDRVWFPSYPYEWSPEMLHAAGQL